MKLSLIVTVLLLLLVSAFVVQNAAIVEVRFLFWTTELPRALLIFIAFFAGGIAGWFVRAMYRISRTSRK